jgi:hypothetical protein
MDGQIDQMIAENIFMAKIVVEGKTEARRRTIEPKLTSGCGKEGLFDFFPAQFVQMQAFVIKDICLVIKMP